MVLWLLMAGCTAPEPVSEAVEPPPTSSLPSDSGTTWTPPSDEEDAWITLSLPAGAREPIVLEMSREEVDELLGPIAADLELLTLDPDQLLRAALQFIRNSCGTDWTSSDATPEFDCSLTELGRTYGPDWASSPEFATVRLLASTAYNTDPDGTSLEGVAGAANLLRIGGGFDDILADTLERGKGDLAVGDDALVGALRERLLATHPETTEDGGIPITLEDALADLDTLTDRLGPAGDHPGIVDPSERMVGEVLGPDFGMELEMASNLEVFDGVDLSVGKGYLVVSDGDDPVELDFLEPSRFRLQGLVDQPTTDLRFAMSESPDRAEACTPEVACWDNLPGNPVNAASVWAMEPWTTEYIIADASRREHVGREYTRSYSLLFIPVVNIRIGQNSPGGWIDYDVLLDIGNPPTPQYLWELILEVAQQNLHEGPRYSLPEGAVNAAFSLQGVPTGLSAVDAEAEVRVNLQAQSSEIAQALFGDYRKNSDPVDLFFARDADGQPSLQFVSGLDRSAEGSPIHARPGFYLDAALTQRASAERDGRHVWPVVMGESTLYAQDDAGQVFRIDVASDGEDATTIQLRWTEVMP